MKVIAESKDELIIASPGGFGRMAGGALLVVSLEMALFGLLGSSRQPTGRQTKQEILTGLAIAIAFAFIGMWIIVASSGKRFRFDGTQRKLFISSGKVTKSIDFDDISDAMAMRDRSDREDWNSYSLYLILYGQRPKIEVSPYDSTLYQHEYEDLADQINAFLSAHPAS